MDQDGGEKELKFALDALDFINTAWTQFHAVEEAAKVLIKAGFTHLSENASWDIKPSGR